MYNCRLSVEPLIVINPLSATETVRLLEVALASWKCCDATLWILFDKFYFGVSSTFTIRFSQTIFWVIYNDNIPISTSV